MVCGWGYPHIWLFHLVFVKNTVQKVAVFPLSGKTQVIKATLLKRLDGDSHPLHGKEVVSYIFIHCLMKEALWAFDLEWDEKKVKYLSHHSHFCSTKYIEQAKHIFGNAQDMSCEVSSIALCGLVSVREAICVGSWLN